MALHPNPISQYGATGEGAGGVHSQNPEAFSRLSVSLNHLVHQGAFPNTGKAADANNIGPASIRIKGF
jgi:hypothetical protein